MGRYGRKIVKGEASSRPCMPQSECGVGHTGYRIFSDSSPDGSQDTGGAFRSRVQRPGVRGCSHEQRSKTSIPQRTDLAQVKRDRHTGRPRKARSTKAFRLRQSIISAEVRRKRPSLPTGEVRPSEHNYDYEDYILALYLARYAGLRIHECFRMDTAYELIRSGQIRSVRIGRQIRIPRDALLEFLRK